jgi:hypothetical protein
VCIKYAEFTAAIVSEFERSLRAAARMHLIGETFPRVALPRSPRSTPRLALRNRTRPHIHPCLPCAIELPATKALHSFELDWGDIRQRDIAAVPAEHTRTRAAEPDSPRIHPCLPCAIEFPATIVLHSFELDWGDIRQRDIAAFAAEHAGTRTSEPDTSTHPARRKAHLIGERGSRSGTLQGVSSLPRLTPGASQRVPHLRAACPSSCTAKRECEARTFLRHGNPIDDHRRNALDTRAEVVPRLSSRTGSATTAAREPRTST